jgi:hypothetical protein
MKSSNHCRRKIQPLLVILFAVMFILLGGLASCGPVKQCDEVGQEFYKCLKSKNFGQILQYLDEEAIKETPERIWIDGLMRKDHDFGMLLKQECYGFDNETHDNVTRIAIKYRVYYSKCTLFEKLEFIQRQSGYKITYYKFDVDSALVE